MRTPIRSENEAFRLALAGAAVILLSVAIGLLVSPLAGIVLFVVALAIGAIAYVRASRRDHPPVLGPAARARHPHGAAPGVRHVLVVANEALSGEQLREEILGPDGGRVEVDVLAPVLVSRLHTAMSDIDHELRDARSRLRRSLRWAERHGIAARGEVGDPSATTALADELRDFGADAVIVVTHPRDRQTWQERGELERLRRELDVPVSHVVAEPLVDGGEGADGAAGPSPGRAG